MDAHIKSRLVSAEEARKLLAAALAGPWVVSYEDRTDRKLGHRATIRQGVMQGGCAHGIAAATGWSKPNAEAELIAAAPDLAATVIALTAERDSERANGNDLADAVVRLEAERDRLRDIVACERGERATGRPVTPTPTPKPANWSQFRLAGAISALTTLATTRLPDPRDDADLREALALLVGIMRRMKDNRKEAK